jgi:hypothetical protein
MLRGPVGRGAFPPDDDLRLVSLATSLPQDHGLTVTCWSGDELAARIINEAHHRRMSRSTVCRHLQELDLKPHKSVYWLNSHDPDFQQKAEAVCKLYGVTRKEPTRTSTADRTRGHSLSSRDCTARCISSLTFLTPSFSLMRAR